MRQLKLSEKVGEKFIINHFNITPNFEPFGNNFPDFDYENLAFEVTDLG